MEGERPRKHRPAERACPRQVAGLVVVGVLVGLSLGEALLGWLHPQLHRRPDVWQFDAHLGWSHVPAASGRLLSPEFDVEISINRDGLRDFDYPRQKTVGAQRILLLGDSFVEGWGIRTIPLQSCCSFFSVKNLFWLAVITVFTYLRCDGDNFGSWGCDNVVLRSENATTSI